MRFARYHTGGAPRWGVITDETITPTAALETAVTYERLATPGFVSRVAQRLRSTAAVAEPLSAVQLCAPVPRPGKIICVGLNYHDHATEQDKQPPERPLLFTKSPSAVIGPDDAVIRPEAIEQLDYEAELAVVIGRTARAVSAAAATGYIAGYTALNDITGRDAQVADGQFFRGKSYDTFAPMGPTLVPTTALDPGALAVSSTVNGEQRQASTTAELIFDVPTLIAYISAITTLEPGDVISTGTPGGVGVHRDPPALLAPGDTVAVTVEGVGTLRNPVIAAE